MNRNGNEAVLISSQRDRMVYAMWTGGLTYKAIADELGVTFQLVAGIVRAVDLRIEYAAQSQEREAWAVPPAEWAKRSPLPPSVCRSCFRGYSITKCMSCGRPRDKVGRTR